MTVPRVGRILDLAGLLLLLAGGGVFALAWTRLRGMPDYQPAPDEPPWAALRLADEYARLQRVGSALMAAGVVVFVIAWYVARRVARRREAEHG